MAALLPAETTPEETIERTQAAVLYERDEQLRLAYDAAQLGTWRCDLASELIYLGAHAPAHFGVEADVVPLATILERVHPDDQAAWQHAVTPAFDSDGDGRYATECRVVHPGDSIRWLAIHACSYFEGVGPGRRPALTSGTSQDITARKQAEAKQRAAAEQLQVLSRRLVEAHERERRHIAREIHDEVGQVLTGLKLSLAAVATDASPILARTLADAQAAITELTGRLRSLSLDLRPALLDDLGLLPALTWYLDRYTQRTGVQVVFRHHGLSGRFPPEVETVAYRVIQEALTNVARHAQAEKVTVRLLVDDTHLMLRVDDAGCGFDPETVLAARTTSGLSGMQERVQLIGGALTIEAAPGEGTQIIAELPLALLEVGQ